MKRRALIIMLVLSLLISASGVVTMAADAATVATIDGFAYNSLQAAVTAVNSGENDGMIRLEKDAAQENIVVNGDVYVDLNGNDIGSVTVNSGTFYGTDSQTNDFTVEDAEGCGTIGSFTGDVQAAFPPVEDDYGYGYVMIKEGSKASFHYVELRITDMTLRPMNEEKTAYNPSVYYKCAFVGDEVVADNVETFGVALSLRGKPSLVGLDKCGYSWFENFVPGADGNAEQSTLLEDIMHESNLYHINKRNAGMKVYGQAYLQLKNGGGYIFGKCEARNLQEQTEGANKLWTALNAEEKNGIKGMYNQYIGIMQSWDLSALTGPYKDYADVVEDAVTWYEEFMNLPTVSEDMTVDELRQLVVDTFRLQLSYKWTPDENFLYLDYEDDYTTIKTGMVYEGTPYCMSKIYFDANDDGKVTGSEATTGYGIGSSNLFKVLKYYDPVTGVLKISEMGDDNTINNILVNNCGGGLAWALGRVSNTSDLFSTNHYTPANGAIPVGRVKIDEYTYTTLDDRGEIVYTNFDELTTFTSNKNPMGQSKGDYYKSYGELQPGDILLTNGHVRMVTKVVYEPEVVNGSTSFANCYLYYIDQNSYGSTDENYTDWLTGREFTKKYAYTQDNGKTVHKLGGMIDDSVYGTKISFQQLLSEHYIPLTIPEFCTAERIAEYRDYSASCFEGTNRATEWETVYAPKYDQMLQERGIEAPVVTTTSSLYTQTKMTPTKYYTLKGSYSANYLISDFRVSIVDKNGIELAVEYPHVATSDRSHTVKVEDVRNASALQSMEELTKYAGKGNRLKIETRLSTGQWYPVVNFEIA